MRKRSLSALVGLLVLAGCESPTEPGVSGAPQVTASASPLVSPEMSMSGETGTTTTVRFLPPLGQAPADPGTADPDIHPVVEICADVACAEPHARFDGSGEGPARVRRSADGTHHLVNWNTGATGAVAGSEYWIRVVVEGAVAGSARVAVVGSAPGRARAGELPVLLAGQTLPIRFRVTGSGDGGGDAGEEAAFIQVSPLFTELADGESIQLQATVFDANDAPVPGAQVSWQSSQPSQVQVDGSGLVTVLGWGEDDFFAEIVASWGSVSGQAYIVRPTPCTPNDSGPIRFGHLAPEVETLDVVVDGEPLGLALAFGEVSDYTEVRGCQYAFVDAEDPDQTPIGRPVNIFPYWGAARTMFAVGVDGDDDWDRVFGLEENEDWFGASLDPGFGYVGFFHMATLLPSDLVAEATVGGAAPTGSFPQGIRYLDWEDAWLTTLSLGGATSTLTAYLDVTSDGMYDMSMQLGTIHEAEVTRIVVATDALGQLVMVKLALNRPAETFRADTSP